MGKKILFYIWAILAIPCAAMALEPLSEVQMKGTRAQAGISIAMEDVTLYHKLNALQISEPGNTDQYLRFQGIESLSWFAMNPEFGASGFFTLDLSTESDPSSPIYGKPLLYIDATHWGQTTTTTIDAINFCGTPIGSMGIDNLTTHSFHLALGAHGSGVDMEFGALTHIDALRYSDEKDKKAGIDTLTLAGITCAGSFTDTPAHTDILTDPTTWNASGEFTIGDMAGGNPMTLDVCTDDTESWVNDENGVPIANPRFGSGFIALNVPMKGSIRVEKITFGESDLGSIALDNIQAHKLYIEIPGRGLGATYK